ncbi:hypothetical protein [Rhizobacter sp. P5_C2]
MRLLIPIFLIGLLGGCANLQEPIPPGYAGPTALVGDNCVAESGSKARCFVVEAVDGKQINNALIASRQASSGNGFALTTRNTARRLTAAAMKVKLVGTHVTAAPIEALAGKATGTFFSVEGIVEFTPTADVVYRVNGELTKERSSVWIEEASSGQVVTNKVSSKL